MSFPLRRLPASIAMALLLVAIAGIVAALTVLLAQSVGWIGYQWPVLADACSQCIDPSNGISTVAATTGTALSVGAVGGALYGDTTDPRNPYYDSQAVSRQREEARRRLDPSNSPGAVEARRTWGGQVSGPDHGDTQQRGPSVRPSPTPPKSFTETILSDPGIQRYGPRWPTPTPTPASH